ncbi:MAG TPA: MotA/TolQ/ExbB proton channel family protein [Nevskiaceae bacterium]|nr:MotA/TolQ/ExbB proton channel family protein [Nevskiaceae bacterium]
MTDLLFQSQQAVRSLIDAGGHVVWWILIASLVMWTLIIERYIYFKRGLPVEAEALIAQWLARRDRRSWRAHAIRNAMISRLNSEMNNNMPMLRVLVPMSPLLGLVGTVVGMLEVFEAMAARGAADAKTLASGVSQAMVCTMAGLAVSLTGLYPVYWFQRRTRVETELLSDRFTF